MIYAIRPIKSWSSAAYRYQYKPNEGLVVDMVPLGSAAFKVKSAQEISDGEIFSRSDVRTRIFHSNENSQVEEYGQVQNLLMHQMKLWLMNTTRMEYI